MQIKSLHARQILDSRGNPTVECDVILSDGSFGRASVPSGASTGSREAVELRDNDKTKYLGKGVLNAVANVNDIFSKEIIGLNAEDQFAIDKKLIDLDGTPNKKIFGANAILSVSLAVARAAAEYKRIPLFEYLHNYASYKFKLFASPLLPMPMMNIINGGRHANFATDIQEFLIVPVGAETFSDALRMGSEVFHHLGKVLEEKGYPTTVGDEGGYAPHVQKGNAEAIDLIIQAIMNAGYDPGDDIALALDIAASELVKEKEYVLKAEKETFSNIQMVDWISQLIENYPFIISVEDGLGEDDWDGWKYITKMLGKKIQIVGDDNLVTNVKYLNKAIIDKAGNAILIKLNQIGTLTETIETIMTAKNAKWNTVVSHRSGETEDTTISHLSVGLATGQIKTGSLSRTERIAKYNELLRIEELLGSKAKFSSKITLH